MQVEELQWELFRQLLQFVPPSYGELQQQVPGVVLRRFLQHLVCKNRGANRSVAPPGLSDNSVLVSAYCVLLRLLSEGLGTGKVGAESVEGTKEHSEHSVGFLHRYAGFVSRLLSLEYLTSKTLQAVLNHISSS